MVMNAHRCMGREQRYNKREITWGHRPVGNGTWMKTATPLIMRMGASSQGEMGCGEEEGKFGSGWHLEITKHSAEFKRLRHFRELVAWAFSCWAQSSSFFPPVRTWKCSLYCFITVLWLISILSMLFHCPKKISGTGLSKESHKPVGQVSSCWG